MSLDCPKPANPGSIILLSFQVRLDLRRNKSVLCLLIFLSAICLRGIIFGESMFVRSEQSPFQISISLPLSFCRRIQGKVNIPRILHANVWEPWHTLSESHSKWLINSFIFWKVLSLVGRFDTFRSCASSSSYMCSMKQLLSPQLCYETSQSERRGFWLKKCP